MTRGQAKKALAEGKKLTHWLFTRQEWVRGIAPNAYRFEDGCYCSPTSFWEHRSGESFSSGWTEFTK